MLDASGSCKDEPGRIMIPAYENTASLLLTTLAVQVFSVFAPERIGLDPNRDSHNDLVNLVGTRV